MQRFLIAALIGLPIHCWAQPAAPPLGAQSPQATGTNFPSLQNYPGPACAKPGELPKRPDTRNNMEVDRYNVLLGKYNKSVHDYVVCINLYVRNTDDDAAVVRRKGRDAADEANEVNR